jgi:hypothetical protein
MTLWYGPAVFGVFYEQDLYGVGLFIASVYNPTRSCLVYNLLDGWPTADKLAYTLDRLFDPSDRAIFASLIVVFH